MQPFELVEQNMRQAMGCFAQATPESEVRELPGVLLTNASVDSPVFNAAFLSTPVGKDALELDRRVAIAKVYFDARGLAWSFWLCDDMMDPALHRKAPGVLGKRGLRVVTECPGMFVDRLAPAEREFPSMDPRPVTDAETRLAFCHVTSICFRIPLVTSLAIYNNPATWNTAFKAYVGFIDDSPVTTAATVQAGGAIGLYSVATLPEYQGRGLGELLTRHAVAQALAVSDQPIVLQATTQGSGLYQRLGFRQVTTISVYISC